MSITDYSLNFAIAGKISSDFAQAFQTANKAVGGFGGKIEELQKQAKTASVVLKLRKETALAARANIQAKETADQLAAALGKNGRPTQEMIANYQKAKKAVEATRKALERQREALTSVQKEAGTTGEKLKTLIDRNKALAKQTALYEKLQSAWKGMDQKQQKYADIHARFGQSAADAVGKLNYLASVTTLMASPVKDAMAMEDAMADIKKVVDFDTPDGLEKLQATLEKMSTVIPMTADGLAQIAAAAGQAGIEAKDLAVFTEQAAKMGVAFDITAADAGDMMAKWRSSMGLTQDQVLDLADAANALSNANAAQAKQVGEVLRRYGALGQVAGLTAKQTAALAATAIGAGAEAEVAATGINSFMRALVKGDGMSDLQRAAFTNVGFDPKQLQKDIQENAPKAILAVLEGIKTKIPKELQSQYLAAMFGEEGARAMGPMMVNTELLKKNFELVADAANYTGSMMKEFESRNTTTSNSLVLLMNAAKFAARAISAPLLGPIRELIAGATKWSIAAGQWIKQNSELVTMLLKVTGAGLGLTAAFWAVKAVVGGLISGVAGVCRIFWGMQKAVLAVRTALVVSGIAAKVWSGITVAGAVAVKTFTAACKAFGIALRFLSANPIGIAITAVTALIAAGVLLYKNWDTVKVCLTDAWNAISTACTAAWGKVTETFAGVWDGIKAGAASAINEIIGWFSKVPETIKQFMGIELPDFSVQIGGMLAMADDLISRGVGSLQIRLGKAFEGVVSAITEPWKEIPKWIFQSWKGVEKGISSALPMILRWGNKLIEVVNDVCNFAIGAWAPQLSDVLAAMGTVIRRSIDALGAYLNTAVDGTVELILSAFESIPNAFSVVWNGIKSGTSTAMNTVISWINKAIEAVNRFLSFKIPDWVPKLGGTTVGVQIPTVPPIAAAPGVPQLADGGVISRPTLAMIGEGRETEAVMPLSRLSNLLGLGGESAQTVNVSFAPVINITGGGQDAYEGVTRGLNEGRRAFKREFERMMADRRRGAFN